MPSLDLGPVVSAVMLAATLSIGASSAAEVVSPSVTELTVEQAAELIGTKGDLELNHLHALPPRVAELLGRSGNTIMLNGLKSLSPESAAALSQPDTFLELNGLT